MNKLRATFSRSLITGALLCTIGMLGWMSLAGYSYDEHGYIIEWQSMLDRHPWFIVAVTILCIAIIWSVGHCLKNYPPKWTWISSILLAIALPFLSIFLVDEYYNIFPTKLTADQITEIQHQRFGNAGEFLKSADKITLYSTKSFPFQSEGDNEFPELFHGYRVFGSMEINDPDQIQAIWTDLLCRIDYHPTLAMIICYNPRHGLRAYRGDQTVDYHICFECNRLYVYSDEYAKKEIYIGLTGNEPSPLLNTLLDEEGIEREKPNY